MGGVGLLILMLLVIMFFSLKVPGMATERELSYPEFMVYLENKTVESAQIRPNREVPTGEVIFETTSGDREEFNVLDVKEVEMALRKAGVPYTTTSVRQDSYFMTVILPIVAFAFFAVLLYKGVARDIPIAVVDQDNSTLSRKVTQMIDATPTAWVAYGVQGMEEAERLMLQGKVMGIVLIPDFFEKNILNNSQTHLESYLTGTNITVNGLLAKDLQTTVTTFTAVIQLQLLMKQGLTEKQAMAQLMPVRFDKHVLFNPHINYGYYLSPSFMPMMLLIFTIMATIFVIGTELKNGTAREWYDTAGGSVFAAYAGKILPITVIMFLMSELMLLVIFKVVGVPLNGSLTTSPVCGAMATNPQCMKRSM